MSDDRRQSLGDVVREFTGETSELEQTHGIQTDVILTPDEKSITDTAITDTIIDPQLSEIAASSVAVSKNSHRAI